MLSLVKEVKQVTRFLLKLNVKGGSANSACMLDCAQGFVRMREGNCPFAEAMAKRVKCSVESKICAGTCGRICS